VTWPAAPHPPAERPAEIVKAQADAAVNGIFIAVADRCGAERGVAWISGSVIIGPDGYPLAGPASDHPASSARSAVGGGRPGVYTADCDLARARDKRASARNDLLRDRRTDLYGLLP
jgi:predicted amidohydrolase